MITKKGNDYNLDSIDWYSTAATAGFLLAANNLSDVVNPAAAKANLAIPSITNQANNRICTATATTDVLNGEANLTFDGGVLTVTGELWVSGAFGADYIELDHTNASTTPVIMQHQHGAGDVSHSYFVTGTNYTVGVDGTDSSFKIYGTAVADTPLGITDGNCGFVYKYNAGTALVGIGENTPLYTLHVNGGFYLSGNFCNNLTFDASSRQITPTNGVGTYDLAVGGSTPAAGTGGYINLFGGTSPNAVGGAAYLNGGAGNTTGGVVRIRGGSAVTTGGNVVIFGGDGATPGNVFIGDTSLTTFLQIGASGTLLAPKGVTHITGESASNTFPMLFVENLDVTKDTAMLFDYNNTTYYWVGIDQSASQFFKIYYSPTPLVEIGTTDARTGFCFNYNGGTPLIGIAEATPAYTLDVNGDIRCTDDLFVNDDATIANRLTISDGDIVISSTAGGTDPLLTLFQIINGDVTTKFTTGGAANSYSIGLDDTDNCFKIYGGTTLGVTDALCGFSYNYNAGDARVGIKVNNPRTTLDVGGNCIIGIAPGDGNAPPYVAVKTLKYTIGDPTAIGGTYDYKFTSTADKVEKGIQLGGAAIIPALSQVIQIVAHCTENWTGSDGDETGFGLEFGTSDGGNQYVATANVDDVGDLNQTVAAGCPVIAVSAAATSVWVNCTPTVNTWAHLTDGKIDIYITYIDNSAVA